MNGNFERIRAEERRIAMPALVDDSVRIVAATIQQGVHYLKLESDISAGKTQQVLEALSQPGMVNALERVPIEKISIGRLGDKQHPAWYDSHAQSVSINSARKLGVHFGEGFSPGRTWNMSAATRDNVESMRRSLLQETAHHIEASIPGVKEAVAKAWANPNKNPITQYARQEPGEYFAESLIAYMVERNALTEHDPIGVRMVEQAIALMQQ